MMTDTNNKEETFESKLHKLELKYLNKSFICEDKKIHFGKLHVCYVRDIQEFSKELKQIHDKEIKELQAEIEFQRDLLSEPCNECKKRNLKG